MKTCKECIHIADSQHKSISECRAHPPVAIGSFSLSAYPHISFNNPICGEFKDSNKEKKCEK